MSDSSVCNAREPASLRWVWSQDWLDVLFLHWRVSPSELQRRLPDSVEVDTYGGAAWVSLVLFRLRVRSRWLPFVPGFSNLLEANLRTYVRHGDRPGIWFLDVLADNRWAICAAKMLTPMPYRRTDVSYVRDRNTYRFAMRRGISVSFQPGSERRVCDGSLDAWLLERYRLYLRGRGGLVQADVVHPPWTVQDVQLTQFSGAIGLGGDLDLSHMPDRAHFSPGVKAHFGAFRQVGLDAAPIASELNEMGGLML